MARLVGFILLVLGVWLGASIYTDGSERVLGDLLGREADAQEQAQAPADESARPPDAAQRASGQAAPSAVTSRVRDRVNAAVEEGYHRHSGE